MYGLNLDIIWKSNPLTHSQAQQILYVCFHLTERLNNSFTMKEACVLNVNQASGNNDNQWAGRAQSKRRHSAESFIYDPNHKRASLFWKTLRSNSINEHRPSRLREHFFPTWVKHFSFSRYQKEKRLSDQHFMFKHKRLQHANRQINKNKNYRENIKQMLYINMYLSI